MLGFGKKTWSVPNYSIAFTPLLFVAAFAARYLSANVIVFQGGVVR
jgi:hypothetical protein